MEQNENRDNKNEYPINNFLRKLSLFKIGMIYV